MYDLASVSRMKKDYIRGLFNTVETKEYKLGDLVTTQNLKISKIEKRNQLVNIPFIIALYWAICGVINMYMMKKFY